MSDKSAASLEREAEAVRSQVANTADSLRDKMSPGQMIDEVRDYFSNSDGSVALGNLKAQVRDNPLPLALVGAGLAWFFLGGGPSSDRIRRSASYGRDHFTGYDDDDIDDEYLASSYTDDEWDSGMDALGGISSSSGGTQSLRSGSGSKKSSMTGKVGSMAAGVTDAVSGVASTVSGAAGSAYSAAEGAASAVGDTASSAAHAASMAARRAARTGRMLSRNSGRVGRRVQDGYLDILSREPLVLGALGLAVGAAIGAMLPNTEYEDEKIGPYRDRLRDEAEKRMHEGLDEAKHVAKDVAESTYKAAKDEADRQGLVPGSEGSLSDRVAKVASSAAATAEKQVRDKVEPGSKSRL